MLKPCAYILRDTSASACSWSVVKAVKCELLKRTRGAKWFSKLTPRMVTIKSRKNAASKAKLLLTGLNKS